MNPCILAGRVIDEGRGFSQIAQEAATALRLPAPNHSGDRSDFDPFVERFLFEGAAVEQIAGSYNALDVSSRQAILESARHPFSRYWLEWVQPDGSRCGVFYHEERRPNCIVFSSRSRRDRVVSNAAHALPPTEDGSWPIEPWTERYHPEKEKAQRFVFAAVMQLRVLLAALISHRVTSVRKTTLDLLTPAERKARLKLLQIGKPWFSANIVECWKPETALHRGKLYGLEAFIGRRGHAVIGHWRLISRTLEPYWVWIDNQERGKRELGWVQKTRVAEESSERIRAGFQLPDFQGRGGDRVPAIKVA